MTNKLLRDVFAQTKVMFNEDHPLNKQLREVLAQPEMDAVLAEREECAKVCENRVLCYLKDGDRWIKGENGKPDFRLKDVAPNLEAEWEQEQLLRNKSVVLSFTESEKCAAAIRARGQV